MPRPSREGRWQQLLLCDLLAESQSALSLEGTSELPCPLPIQEQIAMAAPTAPDASGGGYLAHSLKYVSGASTQLSGDVSASPFQVYF